MDEADPTVTGEAVEQELDPREADLPPPPYPPHKVAIHANHNQDQAHEQQWLEI
jgi:hypothetical protein